MISKKLISVFLIAVLMMSLVACGTSGNEDGQANDLVLNDGQFAPEVTELSLVDYPDNLPILPTTYNDWDREEEWALLFTENSAKLYAKNGDTENLYIAWEDIFIKLPWEDARTMENDMLLSEYDCDRDEQNEMVIILYSRGSNNYEKQDIHIIDVNEEGKVQDLRFPAEAYWEWIYENTSYDAETATLSFIDTRIVDAEGEPSPNLSYFYAGPDSSDVYDGEFIISLIYTSAEMKELAVLTSWVSFNGQYFEFIDCALEAM